MSRCLVLTLLLCLACGAGAAEEPAVANAQSEPAQAAAAPPAESEAKVISGMSILGNQEAPKSLVIVPWKSSQIGAMPSLSRLLDDAVAPVDKEVFLRELAYYQLQAN